MSNNSVEAKVGSDFSKIIDGIVRNGEPGVVWMDVSRKYGRLIDPPNNKDWRVADTTHVLNKALSLLKCVLL